jgi:hypothetical protein
MQLLWSVIFLFAFIMVLCIVSASFTLIGLILAIVPIVMAILLLTFTGIAILWAVRKIDRIKPPSWW